MRLPIRWTRMFVYGGKVTRYDRRTGQIQNIAPPAGYRTVRTEPLQFSPVDPHSLYFATQLPVADAEWRQGLEAGEPGPEPRDLGSCRPA